MTQAQENKGNGYLKWTAIEELILLNTVIEQLHQGNKIKDAFEVFSNTYGVPLTCVSAQWQWVYKKNKAKVEQAKSYWREITKPALIKAERDRKEAERAAERTRKETERLRAQWRKTKAKQAKSSANVAVATGKTAAVKDTGYVVRVDAQGVVVRVAVTA